MEVFEQVEITMHAKEKYKKCMREFVLQVQCQDFFGKRGWQNIVRARQAGRQAGRRRRGRKYTE